MKKAIIAAAVLIVMIGAFVFSYQYRNQKIAEQMSNVSVTHTTQQAGGEQLSAEPVTEKKTGLIVEDKENDYQMYFDGEIVTVVHGEYRREFLTWAYAVTTETPKIYCKDYDGDGEKELAIRVINGVNTSDSGIKEYTYAIYLLKPTTTSTGEKNFLISIASKDTWKEPFDAAIKCELTQLKSCKKFLQVAMDDAKDTIAYDEQTGITTNKHVNYALALSDNKKQFYTLDRWSRGLGIYDLNEDGDITLDVQMLVYYENTASEHYIGDIHCDFAIIENKLRIVPNSIFFKPLDEFVVTDPRDTAQSSWKCVIDNASANTNFKSTEIDWIEAEFSLTNTAAENKLYFEGMASKIKCVDSVEFSENSVVLTAKNGYTFSQRMADKGTYSVILNEDTENEADISYTCSVKTDASSSVLTITFDKTYDKEDFDKVLIKFGV